MTHTVSHVGTVRKQRQIPVAELARAVGVSRQTIYAIEDGSYVPNTSVALGLSRVLGVTVEDLFSLDEPSQSLLEADLLIPDGHRLQEGQPVRLCRVDGNLMAVPSPALPAYLPQADGVVRKSESEQLSLIAASDIPGDRLLLAGCDPALSLVGEELKTARIEIIGVPAPSQRALEWLVAHKIHAAGSHLFDSESGIYNLPFVQRLFPSGSVRLITFAVWQQGLVVKPGNPKQLSGIADLARKTVRFVNREEGSGSRKMLDAGLLKAGIPPASIRGYRNLAAGHLDVARRVAAGEADAGIATESAARCFGLGFLPIAVERFDLTLTQDTLALPAAQAFLNTLTSAALRAKLQTVAGYDTSETGKVRL